MCLSGVECAQARLTKNGTPERLFDLRPHYEADFERVNHENRRWV